jgi:hypothetical protein
MRRSGLSCFAITTLTTTCVSPYSEEDVGVSTDKRRFAYDETGSLVWFDDGTGGSRSMRFTRVK